MPIAGTANHSLLKFQAIGFGEGGIGFKAPEKRRSQAGVEPSPQMRQMGKFMISKTRLKMPRHYLN
jgi:hypothetical protein